MPASASNQKVLLSAILGVVAAVALGLAIAIAYLAAMRTAMGPRSGMDGLALAASLVIFPAAAGAFAALVWAPFWWWRRSKSGPMSAGKGLVLGALMGLALGFVMAGPGGFKLHGGAPAFNYAFMAICGGGALVFNLITRKLLGRA